MIHQGFWHGQPCNYWCVLVRVQSINVDKSMHWTEAFVGEVRQAVRVRPPFNKPDFYIDNYDGLGMFKILEGGKVQYPCRYIPECEEIKVIESESKWRKVQNWKRYAAIQRKVNAFWAKKDPEGFKNMQAMTKSIAERMDKKMTNDKN